MIETQDPRITHDGTCMIAEASTLEFPVGRWPLTFMTTDGHQFELMQEELDPEGELAAMKYKDLDTKGVLTIFND